MRSSQVPTSTLSWYSVVPRLCHRHSSSWSNLFRPWVHPKVFTARMAAQQSMLGGDIPVQTGCTGLGLSRASRYVPMTTIIIMFIVKTSLIFINAFLPKVLKTFMSQDLEHQPKAWLRRRSVRLATSNTKICSLTTFTCCRRRWQQPLWASESDKRL